MVFSLASSPALSQLPQFTCRANAAGTGWICEADDGSELPNTADQPNQYNSDNAAFPDGDQEQGQEPERESSEETERESSEETEPEQDNDQAQPQALFSGPGPGNSNLQTLTSDNPTPDPDAESTTSVTTNIEPVRQRVIAVQVPESSYPLDWVPREAMTAEQLAQLPDNCCGAFVDPMIDPMQEQQVAASDSTEQDTQFISDTGFRQLSESLLTFDGDIVVQQGSSTIQNDQSTDVDRDSNTIVMEGNINFRELGLLLQGDSAVIDNEQRINQIESAQYVLHDYSIHGDAESIVYNGESGLVTIENGEFSRCEPENEFWTLQASSIILDQEASRGYADNATIRLGKVPIFYYPFTLPFPLGDARASGLLPPSAGTTRTGGFDLEVPYYLNLAPHYDATLSPRLLSDRGVMLGAEFRYLADWSMNTLQMTHLGGDDLFDPATRDIPGSESPSTENRWFVGFDHRGELGDNFSTFVDYNAVSDDDYFYDLGGTGLNVVSQTYLNRQGLLSFNSDYGGAALNVQRLQIIDPFVNTATLTRPYDRLPELSFETGAYLPFGFLLRIRGAATAFDRTLDESLLSMAQVENGALVTGERVNLQPTLGWAVEAPGWFVRTNATYKHMAYSLENQALGTRDDPEVSVPVYSFDSGLIFERRSSNGNTQTLEPRIFYLYSEFEDQSNLPLFDTSELNFSFLQLFREDRFSGGDRITDADQVSVALTSRFLDARGRERARVSLGQILYFQNRRVTLDSPLQSFVPRYSTTAENSAIAAEVGLSIGNNWRLSTDVQWDEEQDEINEGSFQLRYQRDSNHLLNISYRYRSLVNSPLFILPSGIDRRIKQTDISGVWPLTANWKLLGRWNYDHSNARNLESFAGVEWSNCCATIRLLGREWVDQNEIFVPNSDPNRGVFVQITLNGLGDLTGGGLSNLLQDGIWGFRDTDNQ